LFSIQNIACKFQKAWSQEPRRFMDFLWTQCVQMFTFAIENSIFPSFKASMLKLFSPFMLINKFTHIHENIHAHTWALNLLPWSWFVNKRKIEDQTSFTTKMNAKNNLTPYYFYNYNHHPLLFILSPNMPKINHVHP